MTARIDGYSVALSINQYGYTVAISILRDGLIRLPSSLIRHFPEDEYGYRVAASLRILAIGMVLFADEGEHRFTLTTSSNLLADPPNRQGQRERRMLASSQVRTHATPAATRTGGRYHHSALLTRRTCSALYSEAYED